jgi:hypothetical protein
MRVRLPLLPGRVPSATPIPLVNSSTQAPSAAAGDQVYIATIVSVDDPSNPKVATVAPNNSLPLLSGCTIPSSLGVTFQEAPATFVAPPMNVAYYNNTTTNAGGAFCWVDVTSRTILSLAQGDSLTAPVNDSVLFQYIEHNGAFNTGGNFQNPAPIDNTQLLGNPYPTSAPVFSGSPSSFTYFGAGSGSFDAEISFTLNFNTSPWLSTTNIPAWLCEIGFLAVPNGSHASTLSFPFGKVLKGVQAPTSTAAYTCIFDGLSAANTYDLYVYFIDMKGNCSTAAFIATTASNPLVVGNANQQGYPGTLSSVTPVVTYVSNNGVSLNNGTTFDVSVTFSTDSNGYVGTGNQWLAEIQLWAQVHGTSGKAFQAGVVPPLGSGNYSGVWPSLGNGTTYDVMIRYIDYKGNFSALSNIITQVSASGVGKVALTTNPNPSTPPAYVTGYSPTNNGGTNHDSIFTYTTGGGGSYDAATNFQLDHNFTISAAEWLQQIMVYAVANGAGTSTITPSSTANLVNLPAINPGNGQYNVSFNGLSAGIPYALYIGYMDLAGNTTPATLVGVTTAQYINGGTISSIAPNMVVDSGYAASNFNTSGVGSNNPYWSFEYIDGISFQIAQAGSNEPNSSSNWPTNLLRIVSGDSGKKCQALSEVISVTPGCVYYFSAFFGGGNSSGTMPYAAIVGTGWNLGTASGTIYQQISPTSPVAQQTVTNFSSPWTCPSGVTQVCFLFNENNNTIGGGDSLYMGAPFFSMQPGPYTTGPATKSSAATTAPVTDSNSSSGGPVNGAGDVSGTNAHLTMSNGVQLAIDHAGNALTVQFPGGKQNASGALTNIDGVTSSTSIQTPSGTTLLIEGVITAPTATGSATRGFFWGGNLSTNYYKVFWNSSGLFLIRVSGGTGTTLVTATSSPAYDTNPHSVQIACLYNGSTSNTIEVSIDGIYSFTYVDTSPPSPLAAINLQAYTGGLAGTLSNFFVSASGTTYTSLPVAVRNAVMQPNLVVNGNNMDGAGSPAPSVLGWINSLAGGSIQAGGAYTVNGVSYTAMECTSDGVYQVINVVPGQTYTYCVLLWANNSPSSVAQIYIGTPTLSAQWNSSPGTPSGSLGEFYGGAASSHVGFQTTAQTSWQAVYGTFAVPSNYSQAGVLIGGTGTGQNTNILAVQVIQGTRLQDYHDAEPAGTILGKGTALATASSFANALTPNLLDWTTNLVLEYSVTGTSPNLTLKLWYDDGTSGTDATIYNPDGSTVDVGHTTSSAPSTSLGSLTTGTTVYYMVYYSKASGIMNISAQTSAFTITQINAAYADGGYVAFNATTTATGNTIAASSGAGGGIKGGGGGGNRY